MKKSKTDLLLVGLQILLFAAYLPDPSWFSLTIPYGAALVNLLLAGVGVMIIIISLLQLNKNLSIFPTPRKDGKLITSGLFNYMRHPIYSGILVTAFFYALYSGSGYRLIIFILLAILFYFKTEYEEKALLNKFPEYESYKASTGRFFPKI